MAMPSTGDRPGSVGSDGSASVGATSSGIDTADSTASVSEPTSSNRNSSSSSNQSNHSHTSNDRNGARGVVAMPVDATGPYRGSEIDLRGSSCREGGGDFVLAPALDMERGLAPTVHLARGMTLSNSASNSTALVRRLTLLWALQCAALLSFCAASVLFVSSWFFDPLTATGTKLAFLQWLDASGDQDLARAEVLTTLATVQAANTTNTNDANDANPTNNGHSELASPLFLLLVGAMPMLIVATLYDILARRHHGSTLRAELPVLRWMHHRHALSTRWASCACSRGEALFLATVVVSNLLVVIVSVASQWPRVDHPSGDDVDHVRAHALKALANGFGYSALLSLAFVGLLAARPLTDLWLTDICALSRRRGSLFATVIGLWAAWASALHMAFYLRVYMAEHVLWKRLFLLTTTPPTPTTPTTTNAATQGSHDRDHDHDVYLTGVIWWGILAATGLAILTLLAVFARVLRRHAVEEVPHATRCMGAALTLACLHLHYDATLYWLFPVLVLLVVRGIHAGGNRRAPVRVVDFAPLRQGVTRLVLALSPPGRSARACGRQTVSAGQSVRLCLPSVTRGHWHTMTVATSPTAATRSLTVYIPVSVGPWGQGVYDHAVQCRQRRQLPLVFLDAFYGDQPMDRVLAASHVLLVAVGDAEAAYALSVFQELLALYGAQSQSLPMMTRCVTFVWTTSNLSLMKEMEPMLRECQRLDPYGDVFQFKLFLRTPSQQVTTRTDNGAALTTQAQAQAKAPVETSLASAFASSWEDDLEAFPDRRALCQFAESQFAASRVRATRQPHAFYRALHSSAVYLVGVKVVVALVTALLLCLVRAQARGHGSWMLVRVLEIAMVLLGAAVGYTLVVIETRMLRAMEDEGQGDGGSKGGTAALAHDQNRMVCGGFAPIGTYEYESGLGFVETYGVHVDALTPPYAALLDEMQQRGGRQQKFEDKRGRRVQPEGIVCVEVAAPETDVSQITDAFRPEQLETMELHVESSMCDVRRR